MKDYTAIDLFAGCGGLTQGLKDGGYRVIGAVELDRKARETYQLNHPDVPLVGADIREITAEEVAELCSLPPGGLDLLAGCPPCQGFSSLRSRNGLEAAPDVRNDLIEEFCRLALSLRPKLVMMENVPALARFQKFKDMIAALEKAGYLVQAQILDVSSFGVAQRRKRLILSASRVGSPRLAHAQTSRRSVRDAIASLPKVGCSGDQLHDSAAKLRSPRVQAIIEAIPRDGGSRSSLPADLSLGCHSKTSGFNDVYGRMRWDDVAPTITGGCHNPSKGRFLHPQENRPISLREAALLQGFPEKYKFKIEHGKEAIALMIGNALPPPFIAAHSRAMAGGLRDVAERSYRCDSNELSSWKV
jgi:DNA (cytosine-5)-methyltransferase 1